MLRQRVVTALVLIALLLPALFAPTAWPFAVLLLLLMGAAGWEWGRLNGAGLGAVPLGLTLALLCAGALWAGWTASPPSAVWWSAATGWVLGGLAVLRLGPTWWPSVPAFLRGLIGLALLWTAWLALASAKSMGANFILSIFCLVWVADICAYFGGKRWGHRKLALSISPGKSWEGVWSGMAGAVLLSGVWLWFDSAFHVDSASLYTRLDGRYGSIGLVVSVLLLTGMSVAGDLFESLVKRAAGAKDSSQLLPGHGGVLDRIDALLPVAPIALALLTF